MSFFPPGDGFVATRTPAAAQPCHVHHTQQTLPNLYQYLLDHKHKMNQRQLLLLTATLPSRCRERHVFADAVTLMSFPVGKSHAHLASVFFFYEAVSLIPCPIESSSIPIVTACVVDSETDGTDSCFFFFFFVPALVSDTKHCTPYVPD